MEKPRRTTEATPHSTIAELHPATQSPRHLPHRDQEGYLPPTRSSSPITNHHTAASVIAEIPTYSHAGSATTNTIIEESPEKMFALVCLGPGSCSQVVLELKAAADRAQELFYDDFVAVSRRELSTATPPYRRHAPEKAIVHIVHDYSRLTVHREVLRDENDKPQDLYQNGQAQTNVDGALREFVALGDKVVVLCREYDGECIQHLTTSLSFKRIVFHRPKALEFLCHRFALDPLTSYASIVSELDSWTAFRYLSDAIEASLMKSTGGDSIVLFDLFEFLLPKILVDELEPPLSMFTPETIIEGVFGSNEGVNLLGPFRALAQAAITRVFGPPQRPVDDQGVNTTTSVFHAMMGNPAVEELSDFQYRLLITPIMTNSAAPSSSTSADRFIHESSRLPAITSQKGAHTECDQVANNLLITTSTCARQDHSQ